MQWGRLDVPSWGANTVRTEFAVLSGLPEDAIGYDRFDPYHQFSRTPVDSLAWQLRAEGYFTIFVHPFDRKFYKRHRAIPNLGFDLFLAEEAFNGASRVNGYISDAAVGLKIAQLVRAYGPKVFIFAVTMENHGPWVHLRSRTPMDTIGVVGVPQEQLFALESYLHSLRNADAMLGSLARFMREEAASGILAFYGDHLPALGKTFENFGLVDRRSEYVIWTPQCALARHRDIAARQLSAALLRSRSIH